MSAPPLVSIVTPSYNQAPFLEETILSVLEQEYEPIEYIVVDDGSTDRSVEIIERYADRLAWWTRRENAGQTAALNLGFAHTSGAVLGFLNADDTLLPGAVTMLVEALERDPSLLLAYGDAVYTDDQSRQRGPLPSRAFDVVEMVRLCDNHVVQPAALWRREAWERYGPFDERAWYFFDFEFFIRIPTDRVAQVQAPVATYRIHAAAKSTGSVRLAQDHERLAETFFTSDRLPIAARAVAREGRSSAYLLGADFAYAALDLRRARSYVLRGLRLHPRHLSRRWLSLLLKSFLPRGAVARLRARRARLRLGDGLPS